jgi:predicted nucleotidyltransferase
LETTGTGRIGGALTPEVLERIVRQVVAVAEPERIILFGSAARGKMGPNSDVDLLVVRSGAYNKRELSARIRDALHGADGIEEAFDVVIATPEDLARYGDCFALVYYPALREGKVLYAA